MDLHTGGVRIFDHRVEERSIIAILHKIAAQNNSLAPNPLAKLGFISSLGGSYEIREGDPGERSATARIIDSDGSILRRDRAPLQHDLAIPNLSIHAQRFFDDTHREASCGWRIVGFRRRRFHEFLSA